MERELEKQTDMDMDDTSNINLDEWRPKKGMIVV